MHSRPQVVKMVQELISLARQHERLAVKHCNVGMDEADEQREKVIEERIAKVAREAFHGLQKVEFGGDPRGFTVKLHLKSGAYNSWGGKESGYGIPT